MRGLGIGIILTTLIFSIGGTKEKLTDQEIIARAEALGMVKEDEKEKNLDNVLAEINQSVTPAQEITNAPTLAPTLAPTAKPTAVPTKAPTPEPTKQPTKVPTPEPTKVPSPKPTQKPKPTPTQKPKSDTDDKNQVKDQAEKAKITFTISSGMTSEKVAAILKEKGLISSAADFDRYIIRAGKASDIKVGTYTILKGATYSQIISKITTK